jgi:hypothetical protein
MTDHKILPQSSASSNEEMSKAKFDQVELVEEASVHGSMPEKTSRAPEIIRAMTAEHRQKLETSLRRKIDFRLLPMIVLMYIMNYLDRNNIAAARLAGLEKDLKLHGNQFQARHSLSEYIQPH